MTMTKGRTVRNTVLWTVAGGIALIGVIVLVSAVGETRRGEAMIENPGALLGVAITSLGGIMAVLLPAMLRLEKTSEVLKENVQNDHRKDDGSPLYLRDDMDDKHEVILSRVDAMAANISLAIRLAEANASDVRGMRKDLGRMQDDFGDVKKGLDLNTRETQETGRVVTGLVQTVTILEGRMNEYHPDEGEGS